MVRLKLLEKRYIFFKFVTINETGPRFLTFKNFILILQPQTMKHCHYANLKPRLMTFHSSLFKPGVIFISQFLNFIVITFAMFITSS